VDLCFSETLGDRRLPGGFKGLKKRWRSESSDSFLAENAGALKKEGDVGFGIQEKTVRRQNYVKTKGALSSQWTRGLRWGGSAQGWEEPWRVLENWKQGSPGIDRSAIG